jgi:hypothetical protein
VAPMTTRVSMEIPSSRAGMVAEMFNADGVDVSWMGPMEKSAGVERELVQIVFYLKDNGAAGVVGGAAYAAAQAGVKKLRERFPQVDATIEDDSEED